MLGPRTGIGHYTAELVRCLQAQAGPGEVRLFPRGWTERLGLGWAAVRPWISGREPCLQSLVTEQTTNRAWLRQKALACLRNLGEGLPERTTAWATHLAARRFVPRAQCHSLALRSSYRVDVTRLVSVAPSALASRQSRCLLREEFAVRPGPLTTFFVWLGVYTAGSDRHFGPGRSESLGSTTASARPSYHWRTT